MAIIGVTHSKDGQPRITRSVRTKVAIGRAPDEKAGRKHPERLDHFVFLRKTMDGKDIKWVGDEKLTAHYGDKCREFQIILLDDDPEVAFRTEYAAWVKRGLWCHGDGLKAQRRDLGKDGSGWAPLKVWEGPCAEGGCPEIDKGTCLPSGDLHFMLSDFPTLGSICRLHTGSYQSVRQIHSALEDIRRVTGGRLMGIRAKLFVHPDRSLYENQQGRAVSGTKWVLGIELSAEDLAHLQGHMIEAAQTFQHIRALLGGAVLEIEEDETERGNELAPEFYPAAAKVPIEGEIVIAKTVSIREQCVQLMQAHGLNEAQREQKLDQYKGREQELLDRITAYENTRKASCPASAAATAAPSSAAGASAQARPAASSAKDETPPTSSVTPTSVTAEPATPDTARTAQPATAAAATSAPSTAASPANGETPSHFQTELAKSQITDDDLPEFLREAPAPNKTKGFKF